MARRVYSLDTDVTDFEGLAMLRCTGDAVAVLATDDLESLDTELLNLSPFVR